LLVEALPKRLIDAACPRHSLITLPQLDALKVSRHQRERLLATGQIVRVLRDVYRLGGAPATWQGRVAATRLAVGGDAVVSHRSAAALYELDGFDQQRVVHLSLPNSRSPRKPTDVRLHRCFDYDLIAPESRQSVIVTDAARLILDLYAAEPNRDVARRGLFSARKKRLVTWTALEDCLERHARHGRRGIRLLRADLEVYRRVGCPETSFEDAIREVLTAAGLPEPQLQYGVDTPGGRFRVDVAYPEFRVAIEGKSRAHHLTDAAFESDPVRDAELAIAGWIVIHVTWAQLQDDPDGVVRRVRRALRSRGAAGRLAA
jgi:very-short-patch-repair endonuclease